MAHRAFADAEYDLSCPVCFDIFLDPCQLACGHTLCAACIGKIRTPEGITCPLCRRPTELTESVAGLPRNSALLAYLNELFQSEEEAGTRREHAETNSPTNENAEEVQEEGVPTGFYRYKLQGHEKLASLAIAHNTTVAYIRRVNRLLTDDLDLLPYGSYLLLPKVQHQINLEPPPITAHVAANRERLLCRAFSLAAFNLCRSVELDEAKYYLSSHAWDLRTAFAEWREDVLWEESHAVAKVENSYNVKGRMWRSVRGELRIPAEQAKFATMQKMREKQDAMREKQEAQRRRQTCPAPATAPFPVPEVPNKNSKGSPTSCGSSASCGPAMNRPCWEKCADLCRLCSRGFSLFRRRHHCRNCGRTVCDDCSRNRVSLPQYGIQSPTRVCMTCSVALRSGPNPAASPAIPERHGTMAADVGAMSASADATPTTPASFDDAEDAREAGSAAPASDVPSACYGTFSCARGAE